MKVNVIGKEKMLGKSKKTGQPFDASIVHIRYKKPRCEGEAVDSVWVDKGIFPYEEIAVGHTYDLDRDNRGYLVGFEFVK